MDTPHQYPKLLKSQSVSVDNFLRPDLEAEIAIQSRSEAASHMCWTCGSCDTECPVNIATGRLRPQKIVRLATLGLTDELLQLPEIWYCISCRRCLEVCPNLVKPATTIAHIRHALVANGTLPITKIVAYRELFSYFQRVRWLTTAKCMEGAFSPISLKTFQGWLQSSIPTVNDVIFINELPDKSVEFKKRTRSFNAAHCFNCGECSSACPVSCGRNVFDPRTIFRMANFGLGEELLRSPSLWLCIGCGRCSDVCSQYVDGRNLIEDLIKMAVNKDVIDSGFRFRLEKANKNIFTHFLSQVDSVLQLGATINNLTTTKDRSSLSVSH